MFQDHPNVEDFEGFLRSPFRPVRHSRNAQVMRHLLSDCADCRSLLNTLGWSRQRLARMLQLRPEGDPAETVAASTYDYSRAFALADRAVSALLTPDQEAIETSELLLAELTSFPAEDRIHQVGLEGRFSTPGVIRSLIDRSHAVRYQDSDDALHFAHLAQIAAEACSSEKTGSEMRLADLRTRAWGQYGNALRLCGQPRDAEEAFATARENRRQGTGDPMLRAWLLERMTPLVIFQGRFGDAMEMCEEAGLIYQELGESHLLASTMIQKAIAALYSGEAEQAVRALNQAIPLIDDEADPHLLFAACHNLICCYIDLDRPDQALTLYNEARELYQEFKDPLLLLRATWQEGRLLRDLGHLRAAEIALLRARKGYQDRALPYEMALVLLDLAAVYVKLGLVEEVKRTVLTTVPIFHALRVKLETLAALLQLQQVADQEQQALALIRTLNSRIESLPKKSAR
jgi:tetratricopeptide (TPR) repeat protein